MGFALSSVMNKSRYLKIGLGVVLAFVGVKMRLARSPWKVDALFSLCLVAAVLAASIIASLVRAAPAAKANA